MFSSVVVQRQCHVEQVALGGIGLDPEAEAAAHIDHGGVLAQHLTEGCGIRATARLCHVTAKTVFRVLVRAGRHARRFHDVRVRGVHIEESKSGQASWLEHRLGVGAANRRT